MNIIVGQDSSQIDNEMECQQAWQYSELSEEVDGVMTFYEQPVFLCGILSNASVGIVVTNSGKKIRVLSWCDVKGVAQKDRYSEGDKVKVIPEKFDGHKPDSIPIDPYVCSNNRVYFGRIESLN